MKRIIIAILSLCLMSHSLYSMHFTFTSTTGNDMTVAVPDTANPTFDGSPLLAGDEIGAFTPSGLCVGASVWQETGNIAITVWGHNDQKSVIDGMTPGDTIKYRVWRASSSTGGPCNGNLFIGRSNIFG